MRSARLLFCSGLATFFALGCGGPQTSLLDNGGGVLRLSPPDKSVFIRASFDDDPSTYIGRFVPDNAGADAIDESAAFQSRCSRFIKFRIVGAGGSFEQRFNASAGVQGNLGVKPYGTASAKYSSEAGLLVKYTLKKKMIGELADADAFYKCCEAAPDQCTGRYVGEFLLGEGTVSQFAGSSTDIKASGEYKVATADFAFKDGVAWKRVTEFKDVYFAFRTAGSKPTTSGSGPCDAGDTWVRQIPSSLDGKYFVGTSPLSGMETQARDLAMNDARVQVVKYLGVEIATTFASKSKAIAAAFDDQTLVAAAAHGVATKVKDRCWAKDEMTDTPDGKRHIARVLAFFPEAATKEAQSAAVGAMAEEARKRGDTRKAGELDGVGAEIKRGGDGGRPK